MELNATIFLQMAVFFTLLAWLSPMLFDPFIKLFEERERRIVGAAIEAKQLAGAAQERTALIAHKTAEAQVEARKVLAELRAQGQQREAHIVADARAAAGVRLQQARTELSGATENARRSLQADAKALSNEIVLKVLGRAA
jgi:F-type H+-transporting ATPase subunit b